MSLEATFANHTSANLFMNASGVHCMTTQELDELAHSEAEALITKSCTINERRGNPESRYFDVPLGSINSMGPPNLGLPYCLEYALAYEKAQRKPNQPLFSSIAGMSVQENLEMLGEIEKSGLKGTTELNLSCPNVPDKPQLAYDFETTYETLKEVFSIFSKPLGIKLPPYFDFAHFDQMADTLNQLPLTYVNTISSASNGLYIDTDKEAMVIKPEEGFGGIGREYIKPTALVNVRAFYTRLKPEIQIIGTGGIRTGQNAFEHLLCGASMLQIGTELHKEGPEIFSKIIKELTQIMSERGYASIDEFKDRLRNISQQKDEGYD